MMGEIFGRAEQVCVWLGSSKLDNLEGEYEAVLKWFGRLDSAVSGLIDIERVRKVRKLAEEVDLTGELGISLKSYGCCSCVYGAFHSCFE
jgi:hypothetical protein